MEGFSRNEQFLTSSGPQAGFFEGMYDPTRRRTKRVPEARASKGMMGLTTAGNFENQAIRDYILWAFNNNKDNNNNLLVIKCNLQNLQHACVYLTIIP